MQNIPAQKKSSHIFLRHFVAFSGTIFHFFLGQYFCFLGFKFSKTFSGKNAFLGNFLGYFQLFSPAFLRFSHKISKFFSSKFCFFSPNKINTASVLHTLLHIIKHISPKYYVLSDYLYCSGK